MYTRLLTNFRILGVKKLLGADPSRIMIMIMYALASVGHPQPNVKFLVGSAMWSGELYLLPTGSQVADSGTAISNGWLAAK